jgi:hypothetical protein
MLPQPMNTTNWLGQRSMEVLIPGGSLICFVDQHRLW